MGRQMAARPGYAVSGSGISGPNGRLRGGPPAGRRRVTPKFELQFSRENGREFWETKRDLFASTNSFLIYGVLYTMRVPRSGRP
jgi:hypothetical protein